MPVTYAINLINFRTTIFITIKAAKNSMKQFTAILLLICMSQLHAETKLPKSIQRLATPESVVQDELGEIYVSEINGFNQDGDGTIKRIDNEGKVSTFAKGMDDPKGLALMNGKLYVADKTRILEVTQNGNWQVYTPETAFPFKPQFLNDLASDKNGNLYVSDSGDLKTGGAIYKVSKEGHVTTVVDRSNPAVLAPNGLFLEGRNRLLSVDFASGILYRINLDSGKMTVLAKGFGGGDGIIKTRSGNIYVSDWKNGNIYLAMAGKAKTIKSNYKSPADIALTVDGKFIIVPVMKAGTVEFIPAQ